MTYVSNVGSSAVGTTTQAGSGNRKIDRVLSNGVMWTVMQQDTSALGIRFYYSTDNGVTWTVVPSMDIPQARGGIDASIFIDADDYLWVCYQQISPTNLPQLRRGVPNAGRTSYTWGTPLAMAAGVDAAGAGWHNLVVHREGTGWVAHCVFSYYDGVTDRSFWRRCIIAADGTIGAYTSVTVGGDSAGTGPIVCSIDFNHIGDGKTIAGGTPHIYHGLLFSRVGTLYGLIFYKATYSAGPTWTMGTRVSIDSSLPSKQASTNGDWCRGFFDGNRWVTMGLATVAGTPTVPTYFHYERDAADTTTTQQQKITTGADTFWGDATYDAQGNIYVISSTKAEATGSRIFSYKKWLRASNTFSASTVIDSTAHTHQVSIRGGWTGSKIDYIYEDAAVAPQTMKYGRFTAAAPPTFTSASGSLTFSGSATAESGDRAAAASGLLELSGTAAARAAAFASGSLAFSGSATVRAAVSATGTLSLSGSAGYGVGVEATGSLTMSGSATARAPTAGSGSLTLAGTSGAQASSSAASGSLTLSGSASARASVSATGTLSLSGSAVASARASATGALSFSGTGTARPSAPSGLTATAVSENQIDLTWNDYPDATGYDIERNGSVILINHLTTTYSDTGLTQNVQYNYRVRAVL